MKKKFILLTLIALLLMPITTFAATKDEYKSKNLKDTLKEEDIELKNEDYKETEDQVTIYLFRGTGCTYCRSFLNFLNDISEEYGKYFKLVSYEVWTEQKNGELLEEISEFTGQSAGGVPYIIIGDQVFSGYSKEYDETIKAVIKEEYSKNQKYDVFEEYDKAKELEKRKEFFSSGQFLIGCNVVVIFIATIINILFVNNKMNALTNQVESLIKEQEKNQEKEKSSSKEKETVKKETKEKTKKSKK